MKQRRNRQHERAHKLNIESRPRDTWDLLINGDQRESERSVPHPRSAAEIVADHDHLHPEVRHNIGLVANQVEFHRDKIRIIIDPATELARDKSIVPAPDLPLRQEYLEDPVKVERRPDVHVATGNFPIIDTTVLVVGDRAAIFEGGRGKADGITSPMQTMPGEAFGREVADSYLIVGEDGHGKKTILTTNVGTGSEKESALRTKERVIQGLHEPMSQALAAGRGTNDIVERLSAIDEVDQVSYLKEQKLPGEFDQFGQTIEVVVGSRVEQFKGIMRYDQQTHTITLARPYRIDPTGYQLEIYDGTGQNRRWRWLTAKEADRFGLVGQMMTGMAREKQKTAIHQLSKQQREAQLLRSRYALPPTIS